MPTIREKKVKLNVNVVGLGKSNFKHSEVVKQITGDLSRLQNASASIYRNIARSTNDGRIIRFSIMETGKRLVRIAQDKIIHNPPDWAPLSQTAQKVRKYYLDPDSLEEDIINGTAWGPEVEVGGEIKYSKTKLFSSGAYRDLRSKLKSKTNKDVQLVSILNKITETISRIKASSKIQHHGLATYSNPALLLSGKLLNSLYSDFQSNSKVSKGLATYTYDLKLGSTVPYAKVMFSGGSKDVYNLTISRKSSESKNKYIFSVPIPISFVPEFMALDLGPIYTVKVHKVKIKIPSRNPFNFTENDYRLIKENHINFNSMVGEKITDSVKLSIEYVNFKK